MTTRDEETTKYLMEEKAKMDSEKEKKAQEDYAYQQIKRQSMLPRPVVCLCGSCRDEEKFRKIAEEFSLLDAIVLDPEVWDKWEDLHSKEGQHLKDRLDAKHFAMIRLSDLVYVIDDGEGESTSREIRYAKEIGKPVHMIHDMLEGEENTPRDVVTSWIIRNSKDWKRRAESDNS